jgi:hypothetical protein
MAKVTGPLMSMSASGKLADSIVFFTWKGRNVVRQFLIPANPQSTAQGDQRVVMGGTGRAVGKIVKDSQFHDQLIALELIPGGQTKQSWMVKYIVDNYLSTPTAYSNALASMVAHSASGAIGTVADSLNILEFDLAYASVAPYDNRLGVYLLAKSAIAQSFTGSPYTLSLASWTATAFNAMQSDLQA